MEVYEHQSAAGLKLIRVGNLGDFLFVESAKLHEALEYIKANGPVQIELNQQRGFVQKGLDFLWGVEHLISGLNIVVDKLDLSGIERFTNLTYLRLSDALGQPIDFEHFKHLRYCNLLWNKQYSQVVFPPSITKLVLTSYTPRFGLNEASLHNLRNVAEIHLIQAKVDDLSLLNYCGALMRADIAYCSRTLNDINALVRHAASLTRLDLNMCKRIADFSVLGQLNKLEWLNICDCGSIANLAFLQNLPNLKHFVFRGTVVEDGDLSYLRGIKYVKFDNKPHYSLKNTDLG